jgi:hypothetical protein
MIIFQPVRTPILTIPGMLFESIHNFLINIFNFVIILNLECFYSGLRTQKMLNCIYFLINILEGQNLKKPVLDNGKGRTIFRRKEIQQ